MDATEIIDEIRRTLDLEDVKSIYKAALDHYKEVRQRDSKQFVKNLKKGDVLAFEDRDGNEIVCVVVKPKRTRVFVRVTKAPEGAMRWPVGSSVDVPASMLYRIEED